VFIASLPSFLSILNGTDFDLLKRENNQLPKTKYLPFLILITKEMLSSGHYF